MNPVLEHQYELLVPSKSCFAFIHRRPSHSVSRRVYLLICPKAFVGTHRLPCVGSHCIRWFQVMWMCVEVMV